MNVRDPRSLLRALSLSAPWASVSKHATCFTTFDTKCYPHYKEHEEVVNFFDTVVQAYKQVRYAGCAARVRR